MDTPAAEPSSYSTFDTLCGLVFGLAVLVLAVGACLLLGALATYANAEQITYTDLGSPKNHKLESQALAASLVSYGITCFSSGIPLLIFSYGGWIFLDLARNNRLQCLLVRCPDTLPSQHHLLPVQTLQSTECARGVGQLQ